MSESRLLKVCTKCGETKEFSAFPKSSRNKCGIQSYCKSCACAIASAIYKKNPEAGKKRRADWNKANPEKVKAMSAAAYLKNSEKRKAAAAEYRKKYPIENKAKVEAWRAANPEKMKARRAQYYLENRDEERKYHAEWLKNNPGANRAYVHNRRARIRATEGKLSVDLADRLFKLQRGKCPCCKRALGKDFHMDHKVPLALGGKNIDANIQLLRAECNMKKSKLDPVDFMQSKGFLC